MLACICGGVGEVTLLVAVVSVLSGLFTRWFNARQCRKAKCVHNCHDDKTMSGLGLVNDPELVLDTVEN